MKTTCRLVSVICGIALGVAGCGVHPSAPLPPPSDACTGLVIQGTLHDSLTGQPVTLVRAMLESGTQLSPAPLYLFAPVQQVGTDGKGAFKVCAKTLVNPSALVIVALDAEGNAYPPVITTVSGAADLGSIPMGGCAGTCGFEGSQQTTAPATLHGNITSTPGTASGSVLALYSTLALDGSTAADGSPNLWGVAIPSLYALQGDSFTTTAGGCVGASGNCAAYTLTLPSQNPLIPETISGHPGYVQQVGSPVYMMYAASTSLPACLPSLVVTALQQDGESPLLANPGAKLTAADLAFTHCE